MCCLTVMTCMNGHAAEMLVDRPAPCTGGVWACAMNVLLAGRLLPLCTTGQGAASACLPACMRMGAPVAAVRLWSTPATWPHQRPGCGAADMSWTHHTLPQVKQVLDDYKQPTVDNYGGWPMTPTLQADW